MGTDVVIGDVSELLHCPVHVFLRLKIIEAGAFVLQGVEVPLHRGVIVGVSSLAHALCDMDAFTKLRESFRSILAALVAVQDQISFFQMLGIQCFLQGTDCQIAGDEPICYTGHHAPVVEVQDLTVVTHSPIAQEQVSEIRTPFLVWLVPMEILLQLVFKHFVGFSRLCSRLFGTDDGAQP